MNTPQKKMNRMKVLKTEYELLADDLTNEFHNREVVLSPDEQDATDFLEKLVKEDIEKFDLNQLAKFNPYFRLYVCDYFRTHSPKSPNEISRFA